MYKMSMRAKKFDKFSRMYWVSGGILMALIVVNAYIFRQNFTNRAPSLVSNSDRQYATVPEGLLPPEEIKNLAVVTAPSSAITKIELTNRDKKLVYIVSLQSSRQIIFDAQTGTRLSESKSPTSAKSKKETASSLSDSLKPSLDFAAAGDRALTQKPGGVISKIELTSKTQDYVYTVHFTDGSRVELEAEKEPQSTQSPTAPVYPAPSSTPAVPEEPAYETTPPSQTEPTTPAEASDTNSAETGSPVY